MSSSANYTSYSISSYLQGVSDKVWNGSVLQQQQAEGKHSKLHFEMQVTIEIKLLSAFRTQYLSVLFSIGDWFVLYMMNKNMNKRFFAEFMASLSMRVGSRANSCKIFPFLCSGESSARWGGWARDQCHQKWTQRWWWQQLCWCGGVYRHRHSTQVVTLVVTIETKKQNQLSLL